MTKTKSTKRALLMSALALITCVSMLVGSTFAWFTDSVTSAGNIIKSGNLDVTMEWYDGTKEVPAPDSAEWIDAANGAIFDYDLWEPGYAAVRHIKIANEGSLALKYQLSIVANGEVSKLAEAIDVYYVDPAVKVADRTQLTDANKLGTLAKVLDELDSSASGNLAAGAKHTITLALKMRESAGNEYQNLSIGTSFSVKLVATQQTAESDSFNDQYDVDAEYPEIQLGNAIVPENATQDYIVSTDNTDVVIPAGAGAGIYDLETSAITTKTNANGTTTATLDITLKKDGVKVTNDGTVYKVSVDIGAGLNLTKLMHKDQEITNYNYDVATGLVTFETSHFSPFSFTYDMGVKVETVEDLLTQIEKGEPAQLATNLTISQPIKITEDTAINGNGCTITYTGADRAIEIPNNADAKVNVAISDLTVDCTASYCQRGINYNDDGVLTLNNVTVKGENLTYALNMPGKSVGATVEINDSSLTGCIAMNVWGKDAQVTATNSTFVSVDKTEVENYTAISLSTDGATGAEGAAVVINGGKIIAYAEDGTPSIAVRNGTVTGCITVSETTEVIGKNVEMVAIAYFDGHSEFYSFPTLQEAIAGAKKHNASGVRMLKDITLTATNGGYSKAGIVIDNGVVLDGNGHTLTVNGANGTWDCGIYISGGTVKNLTVKGSFRGIFTAGASADIYLENIKFQDVVYTFNSDDGNGQYGVYISKSAMTGWTSFSNVHKEVVFTDCTFGEGSGYAFCRPYNTTAFVGCEFEEGFALDPVGTVTFENCTLAGEALTSENIDELVIANMANATVK